MGMLSAERKRELEDEFYARGVPTDLDEEEWGYWCELEHQWNQTLNNLYGKIAQADEERG